MPIATRILTVQYEAGSIAIAIRVFRPETDGTDRTCRYEIDWPEGLRASAVCGLDSVQALHLALQKLGADLYGSRYHAAGRLSWGPLGSGYGFPVPKNGRDFLIGDDKRYEG